MNIIYKNSLVLKLLTGGCLTNNERGRCGENSGGKGEYGSETHDGWVETESSGIKLSDRSVL